MKEITLVGVTFGLGSNTLYTYKTILDLEVGDTVVTDSSNGLGFARVKKLNPNPPKGYSVDKLAWVIAKIDVKALRAEVSKL